MEKQNKFRESWAHGLARRATFIRPDLGSFGVDGGKIKELNGTLTPESVLMQRDSERSLGW